MDKIVTSRTIDEIYNRCKDFLDQVVFAKWSRKTTTARLESAAVIDQIAWSIVIPLLAGFTGGMAVQFLKGNLNNKKRQTDGASVAKRMIGMKLKTLTLGEQQDTIKQVESVLTPFGGDREQAEMIVREARAVIDNESRELMAVHHTGFIVAEAGQIYRGYTNSDHGIDGEIEFKDDQGRASGKRLYVQLKSGDSYLKKRERDGAEVFQIKNPRWVDYWQQQAYAVMLVIRTSDGEIRWMDVSAYLKRESAGGKTVRQIIFAGERFDAVSVLHWRKKTLS